MRLHRPRGTPLSAIAIHLPERSLGNPRILPVGPSATVHKNHTRICGTASRGLQTDDCHDALHESPIGAIAILADVAAILFPVSGLELVAIRAARLGLYEWQYVDICRPHVPWRHVGCGAIACDGALL